MENKIKAATALLFIATIACLLFFPWVPLWITGLCLTLVIFGIPHLALLGTEYRDLALIGLVPSIFGLIFFIVALLGRDWAIAAILAAASVWYARLSTMHLG